MKLGSNLISTIYGTEATLDYSLPCLSLISLLCEVVTKLPAL